MKSLRDSLIAVWDHSGILHIGTPMCQDMKGAGSSIASPGAMVATGAAINVLDTLIVALNTPERVCVRCQGRLMGLHLERNAAKEGV